jgi:uncharacterized protein DUF6177
VVEPLNGSELDVPAADRVTAESVVVEQGRAVLGLSTWLVDAAVAATSSGRLLQVVTPADTRITYPLELLFAEGGAQWVVRDGAGGFRDGFIGLPVGWNGRRFVPLDGRIPDPDPTRDPAAGSIELQITTLHPASHDLRLGASTQAAALALTGAPPRGWGTAEPATQPWSTRQVTEICHDRSPQPTALVVVGGEPGRRVLGRLRTERVTSGVLEEVRLAGPAAAAVGQDAIDGLVEDLAGTARSMIVAVHPVRAAGTRPAEVSLPATPYGILIGPTVLAARGVDHARLAPASAVRVLGRRSGDPACWCRLDGEPGAAFDRLGAVLRHFGMGDSLR